MKLIFTSGNKVLKIMIKKRIITFFVVGFPPSQIDLDKLDDEKTKKILENSKVDEKLLREISRLNTEEEVARDITKDLQKSGWRQIKKNGN